MSYGPGIGEADASDNVKATAGKWETVTNPATKKEYVLFKDESIINDN